MNMNTINKDGSPSKLKANPDEHLCVIRDEVLSDEPPSKWKKLKFVLVASGILISFLSFGIMQEKITKSEYKTIEDQNVIKIEKFSFEFILVNILCFFNLTFAKGISLVRREKEDSTPFGYYISMAVFLITGMTTSIFALRWVSYPMQVLLKTIRPIPVMILCVLIGKKTYSYQRYIFVSVIIGGVILFMLNKLQSSEPKSKSDDPFWGVALLIFSLIMDGLLGAVQERVRNIYAPSALQMMVSSNMWSTLILSLITISNGEIQRFISFAERYPYILGWISIQALFNAIGQMFIFVMITSFGSLPCSIVTTTRKFFTIFFSVLYFGNSLSLQQWIGTAIIFVGLFCDACFGQKTPNKKSENNVDESSNKIVVNV